MARAASRTASRVVDLDARTVAALRAYRAVRGGLTLDLVRDSALVLGDLDGTYRHPERFSRAFRSRLVGAQKAFGEELLPTVRLHDLRHTASTNLRRAGVDATTAMKVVGHKSERMHRRYNTVEPEDLRRIISQLASFQANTVITPGPLASGTESVSPCFPNARP